MGTFSLIIDNINGFKSSARRLTERNSIYGLAASTESAGNGFTRAPSPEIHFQKISLEVNICKLDVLYTCFVCACIVQLFELSSKDFVRKGQ